MINLLPSQPIGATPPAEKLANQINGSMIPQLRRDFSALKDLQEFWLYNDISDLIAAAAQNETPLANYPIEFWTEIGAVFLSLTTWMDTPIAALDGKTPRAVLGRDYVQIGIEG